MKRKQPSDRRRRSRSQQVVTPAAQKLLDWYQQSYQPDPQHPVGSALVSAVVSRLVDVIELTAIPPTSQPSDGEKLVALMKELEELMSWLVEPMNQQQEMALVTSQLDYYKNFLTIEQLEQVQATARKRHRGRPVQKRTVAVKALETRLLSPQESYTKLARTLCDCGSDHNFQCGERLRQQVLALGKVLARYGLTPKIPRS